MEEHHVNQKYRRYIQPNNQDVFNILDTRLQPICSGWERKTILDFGCNVGQLLGTAGDRINHENFYGVDIYKGSLFVAKQKFPKAHWIHYDGFNATFNPTGSKTATFELPIQPDIIVAYGVFTHCDVLEMRKWISIFKNIIAPNGVIIFSVWEDTGFESYQFWLRKTFKLQINFPLPAYERSLYLLNRERLIIDEDYLGIDDANWVEAFYKQAFLEREFPGFERVDGMHSYHPTYVLRNENR